MLGRMSPALTARRSVTSMTTMSVIARTAASENEIYAAETASWRVQKLLPHRQDPRK
jgi:hypothetical protein